MLIQRDDCFNDVSLACVICLNRLRSMQEISECEQKCGAVHHKSCYEEWIRGMIRSIPAHSEQYRQCPNCGKYKDNSASQPWLVISRQY